MSVKEVGIKPLDVMRETGNTEPSLVQIVNAPRAPRVTDRRYNIGTKWMDFSVNPLPANAYMLVDFVAGNAIWVLETGGSTGVMTSLLDSAGNQVVPQAGAPVGAISVTAAAIAQHAIPVESVKTAASTIEIDVQQAGTSAVADATKLGLAAFDSAAFVSTNGFITLVGGAQATEGIDMDVGTTPVTPDPTTGNLYFTGNQVAASTIGNHVIRTDGTGPHTATIEIQRTTTSAVANVSQNGVSHFRASDFTVDGAGFVSAINQNQPGWKNLGFVYAASTFTITGVDNTALSTSNPAYVTIHAGYQTMVTIPVTSGPSFIDATGASTLTGNNFGVTAGVAWNTPMPFYIYAVLNTGHNSIMFAISRIPHMTTSPAVGLIGKVGSAVATTQGSMFALGDPVVADYAAQPCMCIGSIRMQKPTGANDWALSAADNSDGIGMFNDATLFVFPMEQMGAPAGTYILANGGTAPNFVTNTYYYIISRDGRVALSVWLEGDAGTAGAGAAALTHVTMPFTSLDAVSYGDVAKIRNVSLGTLLGMTSDAGSAWFGLSYSTGVSAENADWGAGDRFIFAKPRFTANIV